MLSCLQMKSKQIKAENNISSYTEILISSFSELPEEIKGCSCVLYAGSKAIKNKQYLFARTQGEGANKNVAFVNINESLEKFTETNWEKINQNKLLVNFSNEKYYMSLLLKTLNKDSEDTWGNTGIITIRNKAKKTKQFFVVGECGY